MATPAAPSTVADSPIDEALAKLMGTKGPLSKTTGTNPIGYDPTQTFRPEGDTLNISNLGGSGVSTPEQWTHEIQLANLAQQSAQQEYQKQAAAQEFAYKTAQDIIANQRAAQQLGIQQAEASRAKALAPAQLQAAQLGNEQTRQAMGVQAQQLALQKQQQELSNYEKLGILPSALVNQTNQAAKAGYAPMPAQYAANAQKLVSYGLSPSDAYYYGFQAPRGNIGSSPYGANLIFPGSRNQGQAYYGAWQSPSQQATQAQEYAMQSNRAIGSGVNQNAVNQAYLNAIGANPNTGYAINYSGVGPQYFAR